MRQVQIGIGVLLIVGLLASTIAGMPRILENGFGAVLFARLGITALLFALAVRLIRGPLAEVGQYDPRDERPVLEKLQAAGWIVRFWEEGEDLQAEWTPLGRERIRDWRRHATELGLTGDNQHQVMDFFARYLVDSPDDA